MARYGMLTLIGGLTLFTGVAVAETTQQGGVVTQAETDQALRDLNDRLTSARTIPHFENGQPTGVTTVRAGNSGTYQRLELKNDDVIKGVDGQPVSDPQHAFKIISKLKQGNQIEIVRDGRDQVVQEQTQDHPSNEQNTNATQEQ